jgi:excisionase family DNA binding protein
MMQWFTPKELALYLNLKDKTVYLLVSTGRIPHYRIGKLIRFRQDEIDSWMQTKKAKPLKEQVDKIARSFYNPPEGKPGHLIRKGVS